MGGVEGKGKVSLKRRGSSGGLSVCQICAVYRLYLDRQLHWSEVLELKL